MLLPLGLTLDGELSRNSAVGLWLIGSLMGLGRLTFRLLIGLTAIAALFFGLVLFSPLMPKAAEVLVLNEAPQPAELIVVLGGGMQCGAGQIDAASVARLQKGLELWKAGYAPRITVSDNADSSNPKLNCPSQGQAAVRQVKALYGEEGPEILVLPQMRTTRTEAEAVHRIAQERGFNRILLVTSPVHSRRASSTFRQLGLHVTSAVSGEPRFDMKMPKPIDRLFALGPVSREVLGLITYRLRGWLD